MLISHNPGYAPRAMTEDIRCQGLVLGVCDESYFESCTPTQMGGKARLPART